jgi:ATP-dependent Lhr-like helicase
VEEQFASRLRRGDRFQFAGRLLELVQLRDMTAFVRLARGRGDGVVPRWQGGQLPLSMALGRELEWVLSGADDSAESRWLAPLLALQQQVSALPGPDPAGGRRAAPRRPVPVRLSLCRPPRARGAGRLLALRCTRQQRNSIGYAVNDHGLVLAPAQAIDLDAAQWRALFTTDQLLDDLRAAVNLGELARRQFRGIARVAGLLVPSLPGGMPRSLRQLQASGGPAVRRTARA